MTHFIQIQPGDGSEGPAPDQWTEWQHDGTPGELRNIAARKYLREMGFELAHPQPPHQFTVFHYDETEPTRADGRPQRYHVSTMLGIHYLQPYPFA